MTTDLSILSERPVAAPAMPRGRVVAAYLQEMRTECLRYLRNPGFLLPTLLFPGVFYLMFGVLLAGKSGPEAARYLLASYGTFGVMAPGLFGFGVSFALERDSGLLTLKRAMPMPPAAYLIGKMGMAMVVSTAVVTLLSCMAVFIAHVPLEAGQVARLYATLVPGALPFCALGLLLGTFVKGQGAPALINLVYLPMAFLSGLWFPLKALPGVVQGAAPVLPSFHLNLLSMSALDMIDLDPLPHIAMLAAFTVLVTWVAARRLRRNG